MAIRTPSAIQVELAAGDKGSDVRIKSVSGKWLEDAFKATPEIGEQVTADAIRLLQASAGASRSTWPKSRSYTGRKATRRRLPPGHVHSADQFYFDIRQTSRGPYIVVKNRSPYARGVEAGWYDERTGTRRKPRWVLRRFFNTIVRQRFGDERNLERWDALVVKAIDKNDRETRRALWNANKLAGGNVL